LSKAPRLHGLVRADAETDLHAKAHIENGRIDARVDGDAEHFAAGPILVGKTTFHGRATGPLAKPGALVLDAQATGTGLRAGEFSFDKVSANVKGPLDRLELAATLESAHGPSITAKTKLRAVGGTRLDDVDLEVRRDDVAIRARAARIDLGEGSVLAKDVTLEGAGGTLKGSVRYQPKLWELEAHGKGVDLGAVSRVLGLSRGSLGGKLDVDARLVAASDVRKGDVRLVVTGWLARSRCRRGARSHRNPRRGRAHGRGHGDGERLRSRACVVGSRRYGQSLRTGKLGEGRRALRRRHRELRSRPALEAFSARMGRA
jgi:hypothetical protein